MSDHFDHTQQAPPLVEQTPPTLRPSTRTTAGALLVRFVLRPVWLWRVELAAVALVAGGWAVLSRLVGRPGAAVLLALAGLSVPLWPWWARAPVRLVFHRARVRREWSVGVRHAGLATHNDRIPRAVKVEPIPAGDRLRVKIPAGGRTSELAEQAEVIAACLEARELRVLRDQDNARYASVTIVRRDPLAGPGVLGWPYRDAARPAQARASRSPCWWRRPRWTLTRSWSRWTASWWSWPAGAAWPRARSASTWTTPSGSCSGCRLSWMCVSGCCCEPTGGRSARGSGCR